MSVWCGTLSDMSDMSDMSDKSDFIGVPQVQKKEGAAKHRVLQQLLLGKSFGKKAKKMARETGIEPATSTVTGWYSNQLSYSPA